MLGTSSTVFPNLGSRILSTMVHFFGACLLSFVLSRRITSSGFSSLFGLLYHWRAVSIARLAVIFAFADSLIFILFSGILVHGAGLELDGASCKMAWFSCVFLYASSKAFIYVFLTERVWIVWRAKDPSRQASRWKSPLYLLCLFSILLYVSCPIVALMFPVRKTGKACYIGLQRPSSLLVVSYDGYITILLTSLFVYPLVRDEIISPKLRRVASRTLVASTVALVTSALNITVLTILHGTERGWICITSCGSDVCINALAIYSVTEVGRRSNAVTADLREANADGNGRRVRINGKWRSVEVSVRRRVGRRRASSGRVNTSVDLEESGGQPRRASDPSERGRLSSIPTSWFSRGNIQPQGERPACTPPREDHNESFQVEGKEWDAASRDDGDRHSDCNDTASETGIDVSGEERKNSKRKGKGKAAVKAGNPSPITSVFSGWSGRRRSRREEASHRRRRQRAQAQLSNRSRSTTPSLGGLSQHQQSTIHGLRSHITTTTSESHSPSRSPSRLSPFPPSRSQSPSPFPVTIPHFRSWSPSALDTSEFLRQDVVISSSHPHPDPTSNPVDPYSPSSSEDQQAQPVTSPGEDITLEEALVSVPPIK